jgi:hypothetical protein
MDPIIAQLIYQVVWVVAIAAVLIIAAWRN